MIEVIKIEKFLGKKLIGENFKLSDNFFSSLKNAKDRTIVFSNKDLKNLDIFENKKILLISNFKMEITKNISQIIVENPKEIFFKIIKKFYRKRHIKKSPNIGKKTILEDYVYLGNNVKIGRNCHIQSNVTISDNVIIGNNTTIKSGSVIGRRGFGTIKDKNGKLQEVDHYGSVIIGNNVEIGALNSIPQGTIDDTKILDYNKTDDNVHIAHNCILNENNTICASVSFGGSVLLGKNNFIGLSVIIRNGLKIGDNNFIGQGANVTKDISSGLLMLGNPARPFKKI